MDDTKAQLDNEAKKEYLRSYQRALRREKYIEEEIQQLRMDKMFPSLVSDGMPKGSSQSDLSDYVVLLDEQIEELKKERLKRARIRGQIEKRIQAMKDEDEMHVLRLRYIKGLKWEKVAEEMGYSWRKVHNVHGSALKNFMFEKRA